MPTSFDWFETISNLPSSPIPAEWLATRGKDVKVAFIDTGVSLGLNSLRQLDKAGRKFYTGSPTFSVDKLTGQDAVGESFTLAGNGHGTMYASLLAGKTPVPVPTDKDLVSGIADAANYYIIKATDDTGEITTIKHLLDALTLCANLGVEIAITGQSIALTEMGFEHLTLTDINKVFDLPGVKSMQVFAPLKDRKSAAAWTGLVDDNFPNFHLDVFNVAALPGIFPEISDVIKAMHLPFLLAGFKGEILSKTGDALTLGPVEDSDIEFFNSSAVAIMGGIGILALSFFKSANGGALPTKDQFANLLNNCCRPIDDAIGAFDQPTLFKNFNPST